MKNLLVAIESCEAVTVASPIMQCTIDLASAMSSKVWLLHSVPRARQPPFNIDDTTLRREVAAEYHHEHEFLQRLAQCLRDRDIEANALLVEGSPVSAILKEADRLDIDLIILGCHRSGLLYHALLDATEAGLVGKCPRPIMFIPDPEE